MAIPDTEFVATAVKVREGMVELTLSDGSSHAFPIHYYPRLRGASETELEQVSLRVGGRALRWELLDEDIWIADAVCQNYPRQSAQAVKEPRAPYPEQ